MDQPTTYQIRVPGELDESWTDWAGGTKITVDSEGDSPPVTSLTGIVTDQAGLHSLLRRPCSLGPPFISVESVACDA